MFTSSYFLYTCRRRAITMVMEFPLITTRTHLEAEVELPRSWNHAGRAAPHVGVATPGEYLGALSWSGASNCTKPNILPKIIAIGWVVRKINLSTANKKIADATNRHLISKYDTFKTSEK